MASALCPRTCGAAAEALKDIKDSSRPEHTISTTALSARSDLQLNKRESAADHFAAALQMTGSEPERRLLKEKMAWMESSRPGESVQAYCTVGLKQQTLRSKTVNSLSISPWAQYNFSYNSCACSCAERLVTTNRGFLPCPGARLGHDAAGAWPTASVR